MGGWIWSTGGHGSLNSGKTDDQNELTSYASRSDLEKVLISGKITGERMVDVDSMISYLRKISGEAEYSLYSQFLNYLTELMDNLLFLTLDDGLEMEITHPKIIPRREECVELFDSIYPADEKPAELGYMMILQNYVRKYLIAV